MKINVGMRIPANCCCHRRCRCSVVYFLSREPNGDEQKAKEKKMFFLFPSPEQCSICVSEMHQHRALRTGTVIRTQVIQSLLTSSCASVSCRCHTPSVASAIHLNSLRLGISLCVWAVSLKTKCEKWNKKTKTMTDRRFRMEWNEDEEAK